MNLLYNFMSNIAETTKTLWTGIRLTTKHFFQANTQRMPLSIEHPNYFTQDTGLFTTQYPHEAIPIPDHGRNRLHNEIDDCIVCDLCAKICPVDCIEIEPIKSTEEIGKTSDGSSKRIYAAKFDIDMGKCCYCGLCTTVCPTECLTMTNAFDYSEYDIKNMIYNFSDLSPEQAQEKKLIYEEAQRLKAEAKAKSNAEKPVASQNKDSLSNAAKPAFKPSIKPISKPKTEDGDVASKIQEAEKGVVQNQHEDKKSTSETSVNLEPTQKEETSNLPKSGESPNPKPVFKPIIKIPSPQKPKDDNPSNN